MTTEPSRGPAGASAPAAPPVDVARLMEEIRARVQARRASGFYSEAEVQRIVQMELEVTEVTPTFEREIDRHLGRLNEDWDTSADPSITSHRRGVGVLIVTAKRILRRLTKPYIGLVLTRQVDFNSTLVQLLNVAHDGVARLTRDTLETHERLAAEHAQGVRRHRELTERLEALTAELASLRAAVDLVRAPAPAVGLPPLPVAPAGAGTLPVDAYLRFEDRHRGSQAEIRERQRAYLDLFPAGPVLDVGCGRGEFLALCREAGVPARGIDVDPGMVARCREAGLDAIEGDALPHLAGLPDGSLGGLFCAQVIEHLPAETLVALVRLAHAKLRSGGVLLCETPNPACLSVFSGAFYVDLSHIKPIHPEAARFLLEAAGFREVEIRLVNPYPPDAKLQPLELLWYMRRYEEAFVTAINDNFTRLNQLLWGAQDYAVIGKKP